MKPKPHHDVETASEKRFSGARLLFPIACGLLIFILIEYIAFFKTFPILLWPASRNGNVDCGYLFCFSGHRNDIRLS